MKAFGLLLAIAAVLLGISVEGARVQASAVAAVITDMFALICCCR
jgi:hypothetical protein